MAKAWLDISRFSGLNIVDPPERLLPGEDGAYPLRVAENVILDDTKALSTRPGTSRKLSIAGAHSLWANQAETIALYVRDNALYSLSEAGGVYSATLIRSALPSGFRMSYAELSGMIFYTNNAQTGYLDRNLFDHAIPEPDQEFKVALPAGRFIEYYRGRMYVAVDNVLWFTDPGAPFRVDQRHGFIQLESSIRLLRAVDYGIYLSDEEKIYFLDGLSPKESTMKLVKPYPAIPYTDVTFNGQSYANGETAGKMAIFTTQEGVCIGTSTGEVINITENKYIIGTFFKGAGLVIPEAGKTRYLGILSR
ncbi:MAG: hypothetical protein A4E65_00801 [Syntrophorhabdus sp. PtaU1.Bin153]|nr:MAG: hypothetical protein A4E65_00801 [Syntrophorhabdus sp. PtaU1.Bin153]